MPSSVLFVDDDQGMCDLVSSALSSRDFVVQTHVAMDEAVLALKQRDFDVVVTDVNMGPLGALGGMDGIAFCRHVTETHPDVPVVILTAFGDMPMAVAAIRAGAYDFMSKPVQPEQLAFTVQRAAHFRGLRAEVNSLHTAKEDSESFDEILGESHAMAEVFDLLRRVAASEATVLVTGETGTGKELVAKALHARGRRKAGPFVAINCAAMPEPILESELFGHARGAFTDARSATPGLLVRATGGTLFLDEIGEMPLGMQVKLLRALQERTARPVGGDHEVPFDVRVIAATNRDLEADVAAGRFREDLYYRVNVVRVDVPPLRARGTDVLLLARNFIEHFAGPGKQAQSLSTPAARRLLAYDWPGNVRDLQNCVERSLAVSRFDQIGVDDLPLKIREHVTSALVVPIDDPREMPSMAEVEYRYIRKVLHAVGGNKTLAAKVLAFDRRTLYRKLERA